MKYEVKIVYNEMKYEFDIDAATGTILEWDMNQCTTDKALQRITIIP